MSMTRAGGALGNPRLYVTANPVLRTRTPTGRLKGRNPAGWRRATPSLTGQCPVLKYNRADDSILHEQGPHRQAVNATVIPWTTPLVGNQEFDQGGGTQVRVENPHWPDFQQAGLG